MTQKNDHIRYDLDRFTAAPAQNIPPDWLQRPHYVDPPTGWAYGFPRLYDPATDGDMTEWLIACGYPETLARQGVPCTFTQPERLDE